MFSKYLSFCWIAHTWHITIANELERVKRHTKAQSENALSHHYICNETVLHPHKIDQKIFDGTKIDRK